MCRMLGMVSERPQPVADLLLDAPHSLLRQSRMSCQPNSGCGPHADGWGLAWRTDGSVRLAKSGKSAGNDPEFPRQAREPVTDLLLAHVRQASHGATNPENAHPFQTPDRRLTLAHNGTIHCGEGFHLAEGRTDSAVFLDWLSARWRGQGGELVQLLRQAAGSFGYSALNLLLTDGERLYALRCFSPTQKHAAYYTLFFRESAGRLVVASEPPDEVGGWVPLDNGELLVAAPGSLERIRI